MINKLFLRKYQELRKLDFELGTLTNKISSLEAEKFKLRSKYQEVAREILSNFHNRIMKSIDTSTINKYFELKFNKAGILSRIIFYLQDKRFCRVWNIDFIYESQLFIVTYINRYTNQSKVMYFKTFEKLLDYVCNVFKHYKAMYQQNKKYLVEYELSK